jgi:hypothetical protein
MTLRLPLRSAAFVAALVCAAPAVANDTSAELAAGGLVVDKGAPRNLVSFCADGVKKIGPPQFEVRRKNWRPEKDLQILLLEQREP